MSQLHITHYLNDLAQLKRVSGVHRESVVREAFKDLLKNWGKSQGLTFIPEYEFVTTAKVRNSVDGAAWAEEEPKRSKASARRGRRRCYARSAQPRA